MYLPLNLLARAAFQMKLQAWLAPRGPSPQMDPHYNVER